MKRGSIAVLLAAVILGLSACAWADEPPADAKTVKTTCEGPEGCKNLRLMSSLMTPNLFHMPIGKETPVKILGAEMLMKYDLVGNGCTLGLDLNLDGVIGKDEVVSSTGTYPTVTDFHVKGKKDGADIDAIVHVNFRSADLRDNRNMYFSLCINCCRKCTIDGVVVRVFDEDLDGKFMQDSAQKAAAPAVFDKTTWTWVKAVGDTIAIGPSQPMPLTKRHMIAGKLYNLKVAEDGSSITYWLAKDVKTGKIGAIKIPALKLLLIAGDEGAYDLAGCGASGIPVGTYRLCYGTLGQGSQTFMIGTEISSKEVKLEIVEGDNTLKIGAPFTYAWTPKIVGGRIIIDSSEAARFVCDIVGAGGETYEGTMGQPWDSQMAFKEGDKMVQTVAKLWDYRKDAGIPIPKGVSDANGKVIMAANVPLLGIVATTLTIKEIKDKQAEEDNKKDKEDAKEEAKDKGKGDAGK